MVDMQTIAIAAAGIGVVATVIYVGAIGYGVRFLQGRNRRADAEEVELAQLAKSLADGQRELVEETRKMAGDLRELDRLLKEA